MRRVLRLHLGLALLIHVAAVAVAIRAMDATVYFLNQFIQVYEYPAFFELGVYDYYRSEYLALPVLLIGLGFLVKASERVLAHATAAVYLLAIGLLATTSGAVGLLLQQAAEFIDDSEFVDTANVENHQSENGNLDVTPTKGEMIDRILDADMLTEVPQDAENIFFDLNPDGTQAERDKFIAEMTSVYEKMFQQFGTLMNEEFSSEEIKVMHAFFSTPTGRKYKSFLHSEGYVKSKGALKDGVREAVEAVMEARGEAVRP